MKKPRYGKEQREEALKKVREGRSVQSVSEEYGISPQTMYSWLNRDSKGEYQDVLKVSRLKRENQALLELVGRLTLRAETGEKNRTRERKH